MFYTLHRLVKGLTWAAVLALLYWAWLQREALEPVYAWHDVYQNGGFNHTEPLPTIQGRGLQVVDGHTFTILSDKRVYNVRLTGFEIPQPPLTLPEIQLEKRRREYLRGAIISNQVHVEVTFSNLNSLLGVAYVGATNLNIHFLTNDLSQFNRDYVKSTPRDTQYRFFSAARAHRKWKEARESKLASSN
jgi:hypothetical protein